MRRNNVNNERIKDTSRVFQTMIYFLKVSKNVCGEINLEIFISIELNKESSLSTLKHNPFIIEQLLF